MNKEDKYEKQKVILDASALLALVLEEEGSQIVKPLINQAIMSAVNVTEVLTIMAKRGVNTAEALSYMKSMLHEIISFDIDHTQQVADLYPLTHHIGLSLGDRACISLGIMLQAPIYTADKIWEKLELNGADIKLIRR